MADAEVVKAVRASFPETSVSRMLALLETYGVESYERERERVQLAIIKLSAGSEEKLAEYLAVAKIDYRDVLLWADNPVEAELTPEQRKAALDQLRKLGFEG